jgi:hypothetical protein
MTLGVSFTFYFFYPRMNDLNVTMKDFIKGINVPHFPCFALFVVNSFPFYVGPDAFKLIIKTWLLLDLQFTF